MEKLSLALVGRALLSKALIQLSTDVWGCTLSLVVVWPEVTQTWSLQALVGLMVNYKRVYVKGDLPEPPSHASTGSPATLAGSFGSVSCGITAPLLWVLVRVKFCFCPPRPESLFPLILWKSFNQILLVLKDKFPGDSQSLCQISRLGSLMWGSETSQ